MDARVGIVCGAAGVAIVALAAIVAAHPGPLPGEIGYVTALQRLGEPVPSIAELVRVTTSTEAALVLTFPATAWLITIRGRAGWEVLAIALLTMLVVQPLCKDVVDRPRPAAADVEIRAASTSESFPSGHSLSTTATWGAAALVAARRDRRLAALLTVPIVLTFLAGGVQGLHWPTDAIAGTATGALAAFAIGARLSRTGTVRDEPVPPEEARS